jgi:hypothetical protein
VIGSLVAFAAPTSAGSSPNGQAFNSGQIIGWARELLDPPPPQARRGFGVVADAATDAA